MAGRDRTYGFNLDDSHAIIAGIGTRARTFTNGSVLGSSSRAQVKAFVTPSGGIAARSGSTLGSASCTPLTLTGGTRSTSSPDETVYNNFTSAINGSTDIIAAKINGIWVVIAEDCPSA